MSKFRVKIAFIVELFWSFTKYTVRKTAYKAMLTIFLLAKDATPNTTFYMKTAFGVTLLRLARRILLRRITWIPNSIVNTSSERAVKYLAIYFIYSLKY